MTFGMPFLLEHEDVEEACLLCRELGLSFVELNANFPPCQGLGAEELLRLQERYGVFFTLHSEEELDPFAFQPVVRAAWIEVLRREIRLAKAAGMPVLNMHMPRGVYITLPTEKVFLYERYRGEYAAAVHEFRSICEDEAGYAGLRICIENTNGFRPHEQEALDYLLESPVFGLTLDIGHLHGAREVDLPFFAKRRERLNHMHGHDARGRQDHLALGDGEIDLKARFRQAKESNARMVLETKTVQALRTSVQRLPAWL